MNIRALSQRDVEATSVVLSRSFTEREPLTVAAGIDFDEHVKFSRRLCQAAAKEGISLVAESPKGEILGYLLCENYSKPSTSPFSPSFHSTAEILGSLSQVHRRESSAETFHLLMVGVADGHVGKGIATALAKQALAVAQTHGFENAIAEATAEYSQRLFQRLGFETVEEISYASFVLDGAKPFATITAPRSCKLMVRKLG